MTTGRVPSCQVAAKGGVRVDEDLGWQRQGVPHPARLRLGIWSRSARPVAGQTVGFAHL